jgi:cellulose biosynthesis protein BcsQ
MRDKIDIVIIDTSPTPSLLHGAIYTATDAILYPTKLAYTSFDGLVESIKHRMAADETRHKNWGIAPMEVLGIVPVEYRANTIEQQENLRALKDHFGDRVWNPIPQRTHWIECEGQAQPVYQMYPTSIASADAWYLIDRVALAAEAMHFKA